MIPGGRIIISELLRQLSSTPQYRIQRFKSGHLKVTAPFKQDLEGSPAGNLQVTKRLFGDL